MKIQSGARTGGDASSSIQLHGGSGGGSVTVQPGVGPGEDQKGSFEVRDGSTEPRVIIDGAGKVALSSSIDQDFSATAGADLVLNATGELRVGHSESTSLRVRPDKIIPHVPVLMSDVTSPADTRIIADDTSGRAIDRDALLQQVMKVPLQSFTFTEEWRHMQGMGERTVRAAIGQEVVDIMPDWVNVVDELSFPEKGFALQKFHEVNDRQVLYDTLVSLQAMHRRFRVGEKSDTSSGQLDITTADAGSIAEMTDGARSSGSIRVATGSARQLGESGAIELTTGLGREGVGGNVMIAVGSSGSGAGGAINFAAGSSPAAGGGILLKRRGYVVTREGGSKILFSLTHQDSKIILE